MQQIYLASLPSVKPSDAGDPKGMVLLLLPRDSANHSVTPGGSLYTYRLVSEDSVVTQ